jgi:hypothetical protein
LSILIAADWGLCPSDDSPRARKHDLRAQPSFMERRIAGLIGIASHWSPNFLHPGSRRLNNGMSICAVGVAASTALIPPLPHTVFVGLCHFLF